MLTIFNNSPPASWVAQIAKKLHVITIDILVSCLKQNDPDQIHINSGGLYGYFKLRYAYFNEG